MSRYRTASRAASNGGRPLGAVQGFVILVVAHTVTEEDADGGSVETIRIISARRATPQERRRYEKEDG